jgi:phosphoribosyl-AMP cyclohydrolase
VASDDIETTAELRLRYDGEGLIPAIVTDERTGAPLMLAYMSELALSQTLATGLAHFWSRSRGKLWRKGENSGNELEVVELRVDCDQDAIWLRVRIRGAGKACHTGAGSCFYRRIEPAGGGSFRLVRAGD